MALASNISGLGISLCKYQQEIAEVKGKAISICVLLLEVLGECYGS